MTFSAFDEFKEYNCITRYITVRGQYDGFHKWADAPDEVAFLKNLHRHLFKWEATIQVYHDDRELEFFMVQKQINTAIMPFLQMKELGSCEMQAEFILGCLVNEYGPRRRYTVAVSEDGENDGAVEWDPSRIYNR